MTDACERAYAHQHASAQKRGRNPQWPYVPVIIHDLPQGGTRQEQILKTAFATRDEAVQWAKHNIDARKAELAALLVSPRHRAVREQHGFPRDLPVELDHEAEHAQVCEHKPEHAWVNCPCYGWDSEGLFIKDRYDPERDDFANDTDTPHDYEEIQG